MVSVIVPVYNAEKTLSRCIDSVLNQSFNDLELLLIDDGSSDSSADICKNYSKIDARVRYIRQENQGAASARNRGLQDARGEYAQFVDSDDFISSDMTETLYNALLHDGSDLSICGMVTYGTHDKSEIIYPPSSGISINEFIAYVCKYYKTGILHSCCNKLYKTANITSVMNPKYRWGEDYIFNLEYLENVKRISVVDKVLYFYDCTNESITRGNYMKQEEYIKERFRLSLEYLNNIFHSQEINNIISIQCMHELLTDFKHTNSFWKINYRSIATIIDDNRSIINLIKPDDRFSQQLKQRDIYGLVYRLKKEKISYLIKNLLKKIMKFIRK